MGKEPIVDPPVQPGGLGIQSANIDVERRPCKRVDQGHPSTQIQNTSGDGIEMRVDSSEDEYHDEPDEDEGPQGEEVFETESEDSSDSEQSLTPPSQSSSSESEAGSYRRPEGQKGHCRKRGQAQADASGRPGTTGGIDTDEEIEQWKKNPKVMQFFKDMFDASRDKEVTLKKRNPSRSRGSRGKSNVIDKVKSPSDTTIYAPALNKGIIRDSIGTNRASQNGNAAV